MMFAGLIGTHHLANDENAEIVAALANDQGVAVLGMNDANGGEDLCLVMLACHRQNL